MRGSVVVQDQYVPGSLSDDVRKRDSPAIDVLRRFFRRSSPHARRPVAGSADARSPFERRIAPPVPRRRSARSAVRCAGCRDRRGEEARAFGAARGYGAADPSAAFEAHAAQMNPKQTAPNRDAPARTLADVAAALGASVDGDGALPLRALVHPLMVTAPTDLVFLMDQAIVSRMSGTPVRAAVVAEGLELPPGLFAGVVRVARPRFALGALLDLFARPVHAPPGIHPSAVVEPTARLGENVSIGALAYIGPGARVGDRTAVMPQATVGAAAVVGSDCLLHPGVRVGEHVVLGDRVIVHQNASIGADGFSFVTPEAASFERAKSGGDEVSTQNRGIRRINSIGTVVLGDDVEIGAGTAIDRANIGATTIGRGTKIDNLVQVAHNVRIGEDCLISGKVGISGSCRIGDRVVLAGGVGIADHIDIGDDAVVGAGSGVWRSVKPREVVAGFPAVPKTEALEREMNIGRLKRLFRDLADIKRRLARIEGK